MCEQVAPGVRKAKNRTFSISEVELTTSFVADGRQNAQVGREVRPLPRRRAGDRPGHRQTNGLPLQRHPGRGVGLEEGQVAEPGFASLRLEDVFSPSKPEPEW